MSKNQKPGGTMYTGKLVRCGVCSKTVDCTADDLLRYTRTGWPKCCGGVMTFFVAAERPDPDDTKPDAPPLPPTAGS